MSQWILILIKELERLIPCSGECRHSVNIGEVLEKPSEGERMVKTTGLILSVYYKEAWYPIGIQSKDYEMDAKEQAQFITTMVKVHESSAT